jgi:hypothetical protein
MSRDEEKNREDAQQTLNVENLASIPSSKKFQKEPNNTFSAPRK